MAITLLDTIINNLTIYLFGDILLTGLAIIGAVIAIAGAWRIPALPAFIVILPIGIGLTTYGLMASVFAPLIWFIIAILWLVAILKGLQALIT